MYLRNHLVLAVIPSILSSTLGQNVLDLSGDGWTVSSKALNISVPGRVPSHAHLDLLAANVIGESTLIENIDRSNKRKTDEPLVEAHFSCNGSILTRITPKLLWVE